MSRGIKESKPREDVRAIDPGFAGPIIPRFAPGGGPEVLGGRRIVGMGWQPDVPDYRDYTIDRAAKELRDKKNKKLSLVAKSRIPAKVDNRKFCSPVENQGPLGSCTAHAVGGMMEYLMVRSGRKHEDLSRLFLYKVTRKLHGWTGDTGAYIRSTIKSAAVFGVPPEQHWPYAVERFDEEPSAFLYSFASNFQALNYARLDANGQGGKETLEDVKRVLASGFVAAFGFPVYSSISNAADIPFPTERDRLRGGHAVLAVGYDDHHHVQTSTGKDEVPSLIIRNSWSASWGEDGYGYLPYRYVEEELAVDFWAVFKEEWVDLETFE